MQVDGLILAEMCPHSQAAEVEKQNTMHFSYSSNVKLPMWSPSRDGCKHVQMLSSHHVNHV